MGCARFAKILQKIVWHAGFWGNVLDSSCFYIEIAYSNFTVCGAFTLSFLARHTILAKRAHIIIKFCVQCIVLSFEYHFCGFVSIPIVMPSTKCKLEEKNK